MSGENARRKSPSVMRPEQAIGVRFRHHDAAALPLCETNDDVTKQFLRLYGRHLVLELVSIAAHRRQQQPEPAAGMKLAEVRILERALLHEQDSQHVACRERNDGGRSRCEIVGADFLHLRKNECDVRLARKPAGLVGGHGDDLGAIRGAEVEHRKELFRHAGIRDRQHHILAGHHAEIAVRGFGGVQEK
jgi:hypothetical protein